MFMEEAYNMVQSPCVPEYAPVVPQPEYAPYQEVGEEAELGFPSAPSLCVRCPADKENQAPVQESQPTYLDLDKTSSASRRKRRRVSEWETEEAILSILPKRPKTQEEEDSVFLEDSFLEEESNSMEIDRITSLVSIFSFGGLGGGLTRSASTPDLCSAQAKEADPLQQRPYLAMTV